MLHRYMECRYDFERVSSIKFFEPENEGQLLTVFETYKIEIKQIDGAQCKISLNDKKEDNLYKSYRNNFKHFIIKRDKEILHEYLNKYFPDFSFKDFNIYYFPVSYRYSFRYDGNLEGYLDLHEDFISENIKLYKISYNQSILPTKTDAYTYNLSHEEIFIDFKNRLSETVDIQKIEIKPTF